MTPELLEYEHAAGEHLTIRREGCPTCHLMAAQDLKAGRTRPPWAPDPEPWLESLRRRH